MARSLAAAFAAVEGPTLDAIRGLLTKPRKHAPTPANVEAALRGFDITRVRRIARQLSRRYYCDLADGEDAVQDALTWLWVKRPELFCVDPDTWRGLLYCLARYRLMELKDRRRPASIQGLAEKAGDGPFVNARPCVPPSLDVTETRYEAPPGPGEEWRESQILGAFQRFRDYHGRPPRARECRPIHGLPSLSVVYRHFPSFGQAVLAAGMVPESLGQRRRRWTPVEAAETCTSFKRRNGYWPNWSDIRRNPGELPNAKAMVRFFGGTRSAEIQLGSEAILAAKRAG
jgi:DNA-directed RNA polymerase specialized sigma24 family protein